MDIKITFPGKKRVEAEADGIIIATDQSEENGGDGSAPSPYTLFLASVGTCAGFYVLTFCQQRRIPTDNISLQQRTEFSTDQDGKRKLSKVSIEINIPKDFPRQYYNAIIKTAEQCAVKKTIMNPPLFEITTKVLNGS